MRKNADKSRSNLGGRRSSFDSSDPFQAPERAASARVGIVFLVAILLVLIEAARRPRRRSSSTTPIGVTNGCVYALVALGYTLVYGILELINFAHGDVFMLGGMFSITTPSTSSGCTRARASLIVPIVFVVLLMAMASCGAINAAIEFVAYRPLRGRPGWRR